MHYPTLMQINKILGVHIVLSVYIKIKSEGIEQLKMSNYKGSLFHSLLSAQKKQELENIENEEKILRNELIELASNQNSQGGGVRLTLSTRKGTVDYRKVPCLQEMDLEIYRKPPSKVWSLSAV